MDGGDNASCLGSALLRLAAQIQSAILFYDEDSCCITITRRDGTRTTVVSESLLDALQQLLGEQLTRRCSGCGKTKPLTQFSLDANRKDGRHRTCHVCERKRMQRYKRR